MRAKSPTPVCSRRLPKKEKILMDRIVVNPRILGGKPVIRGTRISVEFVLELLASGMSEDDILEDYSHLTRDDLHACLKYAARSCKNEILLELEPT